MPERYIHERPLRVYWEITRACDLACRHCRAQAAPDRNPAELTTAEGERLLEQLAAGADPRPHVILTGGDPLKRSDAFNLIAAARRRDLPVSVAPSATPLLTPDALQRLHDASVDAISLSLDGSTAERHDAIRRVGGTFDRTVVAAGVAFDIGLPVQVNTLVCADTAEDLPAVYDLAAAVGAARWSLFFLVTVGRGGLLQPVSAARAEQLLVWAADLNAQRSAGLPLVTTTEAPQFRRVALQRRRMARTPGTAGPGTGHGSSGCGIRDGNGILFISHVGDVCPSGFLEIPVGNVRAANVLDLYRSAPLFRQLRDADGFHGRCGYCEYRWVCGGSRARAFAASGDPLGEDPLCVYHPWECHA